MIDLSKFETEIKRAAINSYPNELAAIICNDELQIFDNCANDPQNYFWIREEDIADKWIDRSIQAVVHSHPNGLYCPSSLDMKRQIKTAVPWGLAVIENDEDGSIYCNDMFWFGDQLPIAPLVGRTFRHGVHDCYSIVRDHFRLLGPNYPDELPRDDLWWEDGKNIIEEHIDRLGGKEIDIDDISYGDIITISMGRRVLDHCGVYIGDGEMVHHVAGTISRISKADAYISMIKSGRGKLIRYL
jgi:proteasome lid subunit RPN8/RPN11